MTSREILPAEVIANRLSASGWSWACVSTIDTKGRTMAHFCRGVGVYQFGLVAEDVEKVNPDLVVRDKEGKPDSVRYDQVNAMLLNEFLKEHSAVQEQQKQIESLKAELKEQRILIQKVSAQLEVSKPAGKTVLNNN